MKVTYQDLLASKITVDPTYARPISQSRVDRLVKLWNPDLIGTITVSKRNGNYICVDGQHRLAAAISTGMKEVPCKVIVFDSVEEEAEFFLGLNDVKNPRPIDKWRARARAKDETVLQCIKTAKAYGFVIAEKHASGQNTLLSVTGVENLYQLGSLDAALSILSTAWKGNKTAGAPVVLRALETLFGHYPDVDTKRLMTTLKGRVPKSWINDAKESYSTFGGTMSRNLANLFIATYNKGLQERGKRLKPIAKASNYEKGSKERMQYIGEDQ